MKKTFLIILVIIIVIALIGLSVVLLNKKGETEEKAAYLNISINGADLSGKYRERDIFVCTFDDCKIEITVSKISDDKIQLTADSYGLYPLREDGTISLTEQINTFELVKNKPLVLCQQITDVTSQVVVSWE